MRKTKVTLKENLRQILQPNLSFDLNKIALQSKADHLQPAYTDRLLTPVTLTLIQ